MATRELSMFAVDGPDKFAKATSGHGSSHGASVGDSGSTFDPIVCGAAASADVLTCSAPIRKVPISSLERPSSLVRSSSSLSLGQNKKPKKRSPAWLRMQAILEQCRMDQVCTARPKWMMWVGTPQADIVFACSILCQALVFTADVELGMPTTGYNFWILLSLNLILSLVFTVELLLRSMAFRSAYICRLSGVFDTFLVLISWVDAVLVISSIDISSRARVAVRMIRLLRLLRLARAVQLHPEIKLVVVGVFHSVTASSWALFLLGLLAYMGALFCTVLLGSSADEDLQELFGSVPQSMFTHVKLALVEAWPDIAAPMVNQSALWAFYIAAYICVANIGVLNVLTGVVCEEVMAIANAAPPQSAAHMTLKEHRFKNKLHVLFDCCKKHDSGRVAVKDILTLLQLAETRDLMIAAGVDYPLHKSDLLMVLDSDMKGDLSFGEWYAAIQRLRGNRGDQLSGAMQRDLLTNKRRLLTSLVDCTQDVEAYMSNVHTDCDSRLMSSIEAAAETIRQAQVQLCRATRKSTKSLRREMFLQTYYDQPQVRAGDHMALYHASDKSQHAQVNCDYTSSEQHWSSTGNACVEMHNVLHELNQCISRVEIRATPVPNHPVDVPNQDPKLKSAPAPPDLRQLESDPRIQKKPEVIENVASHSHLLPWKELSWPAAQSGCFDHYRVASSRKMLAFYKEVCDSDWNPGLRAKRRREEWASKPVLRPTRRRRVTFADNIESSEDDSSRRSSLASFQSDSGSSSSHSSSRGSSRSNLSGSNDSSDEKSNGGGCTGGEGACLWTGKHLFHLDFVGVPALHSQTRSR